MLGMTRTLRQDYPELQRAVQDGAVVTPPKNLFLLLSLYAGPDKWIGGGGASRFERHGGTLSPLVSAQAEIAWPPFYCLLTDQTGRDRWSEAVDLLPWLCDAPGASREVCLLVPVVDRSSVFSFSPALSQHGGSVPFYWGPEGQRIVSLGDVS
jgi:hypothetical protein